MGPICGIYALTEAFSCNVWELKNKIFPFDPHHGGGGGGGLREILTHVP